MAGKWHKRRKVIMTMKNKRTAVLNQSKTGINRRILYAIFAACCLMAVTHLLSWPVFAAEEGGHSDGTGTVWRIINFAILVAALLLAARYFKLKDFFTSRKDSIKNELEEARRAKEAAERKVKEFELKLSLLDKRIEEIYREIRSEGELEKKKIVEEALLSAEKIKEQARITVEQEIKKAKEGIKGEIAQVAVEMAEEILRKELTAADHERLIREYLERVKLH